MPKKSNPSGPLTVKNYLYGSKLCMIKPINLTTDNTNFISTVKKIKLLKNKSKNQKKQKKNKKKKIKENKMK